MTKTASTQQRPSRSRIAPDDFVELIDSNGTVVFEHLTGPLDDPARGPDLLTRSPDGSRPTASAGSGAAANAKTVKSDYPADGPAFQVGAVKFPIPSTG